MGWRIDSDGNLPAGRDDISSTEAVNVSLLGGLTKPTSTAQFSINLDASEAPTSYPVGTVAADFKRTLKVFDSLGEGQNIELQFTKHAAPTASALSTISGSGVTRESLLTSITGVDVGETINVAVGGVNNTFTVAANSTVEDLLDFVNDDPSLQLKAVAELTSAGQIKITARNFNDTVVVSDGASVTGAVGAATAIGFSNMSASSSSTLLGPLTRATTFSSLGTIANGDHLDVTVGTGSYSFVVGTTGTTVQNFLDGFNTAMDGVARAELTAGGAIKISALDSGDTVATSGVVATQLGMTPAAATVPAQPTIFPDAGLANTPNAFGWWQLSLVDLDTGTALETGSINFNEDGTINAAADVDGKKAIQLDNINWGNGSALQDISMDIGSLTQFSGEYNVTAATQNGAELGLRTGIEIDSDGIVTARFSNGQTSQLFQLPLATFTAVNGLAEQSGNSYIQTAESGSYNLRQAGDGGAGQVEGSAVEASNVDIADEFTKMIVTQRSYSAGTKIISTADQMTEELLRLR
jgi:flagellar hook protein FlgE